MSTTIHAIENAVGPELFTKTVPFIYEKHSFGEHKTASMSRVEVQTFEQEEKPDKALLSLRKRLLDMPELNAIHQHDARFHRFLKNETSTPWKPGLYLVPAGLVPRVYARAEAWEQRRAELVQEAGAKYREHVVTAQQKLGPLFDESDYPSLDRFIAAFWVKFRFIDIGTPNVLRTLNAEVFAREIAKVETEAREAQAAIREHLRVLLLDITETLATRLTPKGDGKFPRLQDNALDEVLQFLDTAALRNVTDDQQLQSFVATLKGLGNGLDVHALRDDTHLRAQTAAAIAAVKESLEPLVQSRVRGIRVRE
jgi:hypothetical protein